MLPTRKMIRLAVVDDQMLVRQGLLSLLAKMPDVLVVAEAADGEEALHLIPKARPDVLLLDVRMPKLSGIEVMHQLTSKGNLAPTILLTTFDDDAAARAGIGAGAKGFLLKDVSFQQLAEAIRCVAAGGTLIQPAVTEGVRRRRRSGAVPNCEPEIENSLTRRELEVLRLMSAGYTNADIADMLHLAEGTVKNHVSTILSKLGVNDRTRAVLKGLDRGYV